MGDDICIRCGKPKYLTLEEVKEQYILYVLEKTKGNKTKSAKILGISVITLRSFLQKLED